jgi:hypothetical protein
MVIGRCEQLHDRLCELSEPVRSCVLKNWRCIGFRISNTEEVVMQGGKLVLDLLGKISSEFTCIVSPTRRGSTKDKERAVHSEG